MLRLVHPSPSGGQGSDPPKRRKCSRSSALILTATEHRHLRATLRNLARAFGSWACLADAMQVSLNTVMHAAAKRGSRGSHALAYRAAKVSGMSMEAVLTGSINDAGRCTACGSRVATGRAAGGAP